MTEPNPRDMTQHAIDALRIAHVKYLEELHEIEKEIETLKAELKDVQGNLDIRQTALVDLNNSIKIPKEPSKF